MRHRPFLLAVALLTLSGSLSACDLFSARALSLSWLTLAPGQTGTVQLIARGLKGLNSLQIGPRGTIRFDPEVIEVKDVRGANGFVVFAHQIDNRAGTVTLAAGVAQGSVANGVLVELTVRAVGTSGQVSALALTSVDLLFNAAGDPIAGVKLKDGQVTLK